MGDWHIYRQTEIAWPLGKLVASESKMSGCFANFYINMFHRLQTVGVIMLLRIKYMFLFIARDIVDPHTIKGIVNMTQEFCVNDRLRSVMICTLK